MQRPAILAVFVCIAAAGLLIAGPLSPPAGQVASSYKTLSEVEPRTVISAATTPGDADSMCKITWPGSYYLTANLDVLPGKAGIEIAADDVTIDLNGFRIGGYAGALQGITTFGVSHRNITIAHGSVWTMSGGGIYLSNTSGVRIHDVSIRDCGGDGVQAAGLFHRIDASGNAGIGLNVLSHSAVTGCNATANGQSGIDGNDDCTISDCVASLNTGTGIQIGTGSVRGCTARQNSGKGIYALTGVEIVQCSATYNMQGGIYAGIGGSVQNCTAFLNHGWGINTVPGCTVSGCTVRENEGDGIVAYAGCTIRDNTCVFNGTGPAGGAGILATQTGNRIEGNVCDAGHIGIKATSTGNFIVRNTCSGNTTNWSIVAGNNLAPILNASTNAAAVNGNSYGGNLGSTDPNANFSH